MTLPRKPKYVILWIPPWIWGVIDSVKKLEAAAEVDIDTNPPRDTINAAVATMGKIRIPVDQEKLRNDIIESLNQSRAELGEADSLLKRSNKGALKEKQELRAAAIAERSASHNRPEQNREAHH